MTQGINACKTSAAFNTPAMILALFVFLAAEADASFGIVCDDSSVVGAEMASIEVSHAGQKRAGF